MQVARARCGILPALLASAALLWAVALPAHALDPDKRPGQYVHQDWDREDGLPQVSVMDILHGRDGYLWVATQEGLSRFDGIEFHNFDSRNTDAITINYLVALAETGDGAIWAATEGGGLLRHQDGRVEVFGDAAAAGLDFAIALAADVDGSLWIGTSTGLLHRSEGAFTPVAADELAGTQINALAVGGGGRLWIGTRDRGLFLWHGGELSRAPGAPALETADVRSILEASDGTLWVGTQGQGVLRWRTDRAWPIAADELAGSTVEALAEDAHGNVWIGTNERGLLRCTSVGIIARFGVAEGLSHHRVRSVHADREGNLWIGTFGGGLNRLRDGTFTAFSTMDGLSGDGIWSVLEGEDGAIWVATEKGLDRIVRNRAVDFPGEDRLAGLDVLSLHRNAEGVLWVGTYGDGLFRRDGRGWTQVTAADGLAGDLVYVMADGPDGALWVGTRTGLSRIEGEEIRSLGVDDGLPLEIVRDLHLDRHGTLWIGTQGGGVAQLVDGVLAPVELGLTGARAQVFAIHEGHDGRIWLGTTGGLVRVGDGGTTVVTSRHGLFDDKIYEIVDDGAGSLWLTCNRGVFRVSLAELERFAAGEIDRIQSRAYDEADGLPVAECTGGSHPAGIRSADGRLWFTTVDGLVVYDPASAEESGRAPPIAVTRVQVDGGEAVDTTGLVLDPGSHAVRVDYASLSLTQPESLSYRTWLEGAEEGWSDAGRQRYVDYRGLSRGQYVFHVKAVGVDGTVSPEAATVTFEIRPHFHETTTFRVAAGAVLVILGFCLPAVRVRELRRRKRELEAEVDQRTRELREMADELKELALHDPLTGLRNRRYLFETMDGVMAEIARQHARNTEGAEDRRDKPDDEVLGLFLVDIDHFKEVNDTWGHDAGDAVLKQFAEVLQSCVRAEDLVVRWGGEEFLVVLPRTRHYYLKQFAERLRTRVAERGFELASQQPIHRTCSVGFTSYPLFHTPDVEVDLDQMISAADLALYLAKREGRNRTIHVISGARQPEDESAVTTSLASLEWATEKGYLKIER